MKTALPSFGTPAHVWRVVADKFKACSSAKSIRLLLLVSGLVIASVTLVAVAEESTMDMAESGSASNLDRGAWGGVLTVMPEVMQALPIL